MSLDHGKHINDLGPCTLKRVATTYNDLTYQNTKDVPVRLPETVSARIETSTAEFIDCALTEICTEATQNGLSEAGHLRLRSILDKQRHVFRTKLDPDQPAIVRP